MGNSLSTTTSGKTKMKTKKRPTSNLFAASKRRFWTVHCSSHVTQTSGWLPPQDSWDLGGSASLNLPYGWEMATDKEGRPYYVNHLNKTTTYEDPRKWGTSDPDEIPEPRGVTLERDKELGFGFVAGSEKPVIVRFVTGGGPSVDKLMPGDQILAINGEDVKHAPRDHVIQLVRNCKESVELVVCQPPLDNSSTRKSALLSAAKKAKLKSNPSRVRFAESVDINGSPLHSNPSTHSQLTSSDSVVPLMPNVLKVFLENGQTKSFKYDGSTTVQDVIDSLQAKLGLRSTVHFALVVEHIKSIRRNKLTILDPKERLSVIASRPGAHNLRCLFRVTFVPQDAYELLRQDTVAFEYLYVQCCNDVVQERFAPELKYDTALRLAALQMHQHMVASNGPQAKVTVKAVEKECGLDKFIPTSLAETMKKKELRKLLSHFLKANANLGGSSGQKSVPMSALQAKLHYLKIISELPSYGAKCFSTNISDSNVETVILISPKFGVSQINSLRNSVPLNLCDIEETTSVVVSKEDEISKKVEITLKDPDKENIVLSLEDRDADELILVLNGYFRLLTDREIEIIQEETEFSQTQAPPFCSKHLVAPQGWNYPVSKGDPMEQQHPVDLGAHPPYHPPPEGFRMPANPFSSDSGSDADSSLASHEPVDRNRNLTIENNANLNSPRPHLSTFGQTNNNNNNANGGFVPNGILKKPPPKAPPNSATTTPKKQVVMDNMETKNDAVIRRVAEMKQMLSDPDSFNVLNHHNHQHAESGSIASSSTGSGSTIGMDQGPGSTTGSTTGSSSGHGTDSDSIISGNGNSKPNDHFMNEFGMTRNRNPETQNHHSDILTEAVNRTLNLNTSVTSSYCGSDSDTSTTQSPARNQDSGYGEQEPSGSKSVTVPAKPQQLSRLKQSDSSFGLHSPDNFPTGFNPQQEEVKDFLKKLKSTRNIPKNFKDGNLVLDPDLIDLTMIPPPATPDEDGVYRGFPPPPSTVSTPPTPFADRENLEAELRALEADLGSEGLMQALSSRYNASHGEASLGLAAVYRDIESFIATTTIPPPPPLSSDDKIFEEDQDLKAFIIPPPPGQGNPQGGVSKPYVGNASTDRDWQEVRVNKEIIRPSGNRNSANLDKISPKIASLQQKLMSPERDAADNVENEDIIKPGFKNVQNHDTLSRRMASRPTNSAESSPVRNVFKKQTSTPDKLPPPPPPPPRTVVSRTNLLFGSKAPSSDQGVSMAQTSSGLPSYQFGASNDQHSIVRPSNLKLAKKNNVPTNSASTPVSPGQKDNASGNKMSLTSSSDSLSSTASVNTVKSMSPVDDDKSSDPPSLPPRLSPIKSAPPPPPSLQKAKASVNVNPGSPKPAVPSRATKPSASPSKSESFPPPPPPITSLASQKKSTTPLSHKLKENGVTYPLSEEGDDESRPPALPAKKGAAGTSYPRRLPAIPGEKNNQPKEAPAVPAKPVLKMSNGILPAAEIYSNSEFEPDDDNDEPSSLESTSVDNNDEDLDDNDVIKQASRLLVFKKAEEVIAKVVAHIDESHDKCGSSSQGGKMGRTESAGYEAAKEELTNEARNFVTASKLFVKSATESEGQMMECLNHCVQRVDHLGDLARRLAINSSPSQLQLTRQLIVKVRDVAEAFLQTVKAAGVAGGKSMSDPAMGVLMKRATSLASVLTALMRALKVFS